MLGCRSSWKVQQAIPVSVVDRPYSAAACLTVIEVRTIWKRFIYTSQSYWGDGRCTSKRGIPAQTYVYSAGLPHCFLTGNRSSLRALCHPFQALAPVEVIAVWAVRTVIQISLSFILPENPRGFRMSKSLAVCFKMPRFPRCWNKQP